MKTILPTIIATLMLSLSTFAQPGDILSPTAKAAFEKENYEPCIVELSKIIVREPKNSNAFLERARCYFFGADSTADYERLEKIYLLKLDADKSKVGKVVNDQMTDLRNKADADVEKSLILDPKNAAAFNLRGYMKSLSNKNDEAIADYSKAIEIDPKFIKPYYNRGYSKYKKNDYDGAIADFTKVLEFEPNNIAALAQRSNTFTVKNNLKLSREAISDLLKLAKLEPKNKKHYEIIEYLCLDTAYPFYCGDTFKEYIAGNPNSAEGYLGLARSQASVERYYDLDKKSEYWKTAEDAYLKYIELNPTVIEPYIELFDLYYDKLRSSPNAFVMSARTLAKFPNDARSYILSGRMAESKSDWATAVKEFSRAIELNPKLSIAYVRRSNAYGGLKEEDKAFADLNKAIELNPRNGSAYLDRGNFNNRLKKYSEAIADFNEADKLKVTCAKTYRGILYSTMANTNKEAPNTGNYLNAQRDFLADDAQKCYLTHYMYGIILYSQNFDDQAAERFNYALTVYKKHGYDPAKIIEFQNLLKIKPASTTSQGTQPTSNSGIDEVIAFYKSESFKNGGQLLGSGVYDYSVSFDPKMNFKVERGKAYVFIAIKEYDPTFGMDIISNGRNILRPTNSWDDRSYKIDSEAQYGMKFTLTKFGNYSVLLMNLSLTQNASIWDVQFSQRGKVKDYNWMFFQTR